MNQRYRLREQIKKAWKSSIKVDYQRQRINSERSLQASLWSRLNSILSPKTRRMFIEPRLLASVESVDHQIVDEFRFPDIVICNTREVIGVIEIKYLPRAIPNWKKDLQTFAWIDQHRDDLVIQNIRHRGVNADCCEYHLSKDVLFVWAGVHVPMAVNLRDQITPNLKPCFLPLQAQTRIGEKPELIC